jgi:hypothetical protein
MPNTHLQKNQKVAIEVVAGNEEDLLAKYISMVDEIKYYI